MNPTDEDRKHAEHVRLLLACLQDQKTPMWRDRKKMLAQELYGDFRARVEAGFTVDQAMCFAMQTLEGPK